MGERGSPRVRRLLALEDGVLRAARGGRSPSPSAESAVIAGCTPACLGAGTRLRLASRPSTDLTCSVTLSKVPTGTMTGRGPFCPDTPQFHGVWVRAGEKRRGRQKGSDRRSQGSRADPSSWGSPPRRSWSSPAAAYAISRKLLLRETEAILPSSLPPAPENTGPEVKAEPPLAGEAEEGPGADLS